MSDPFPPPPERFGPDDVVPGLGQDDIVQLANLVADIQDRILRIRREADVLEEAVAIILRQIVVHRDDGPGGDPSGGPDGG
jgi:hypothetical protein